MRSRKAAFRAPRISRAEGGRAEARPPPRAGSVAAGARDTRWVLNIAGSWESPADDETNIGWVRACWEEMRQFSTGSAYVNFMTEDEGADRLMQGYGANHDRLTELKSKWDPGNLFRHNKNIAPR